MNGLGNPDDVGRRRPSTLREVAEICGVSIKTVSNVVNDQPNVGPATREHVQRVIRELNYRPQVSARQLRTGTSGLITLAVPSLAGSYFSDLTQHFAEEAQRRRRSIMLHSTVGGKAEERSVLDGFTRVLGDGVVFNPIAVGEDVIASMGRTIQPTVFIGEHVPDQQLPNGSDYVRTDNRRAAYDSTRLLLDSGRRRVAFLGALEADEARQRHSTSRLRQEGYAQAIAEADGTEPLIQATEHWSQEGGMHGMLALMDRHSDVDAVVCGNDDLARGALLVLHLRGRTIPDDVAVMGYDNTLGAPFTEPPLSSVDPQKDLLARTVLDLLLERIDGYEGEPRVVTVPHLIVERESTHLNHSMDAP